MESKVPEGKVAVDEAIKQLVAARATVHIISYTDFVRQTYDAQPSNTRSGCSDLDERQSSAARAGGNAKPLVRRGHQV